MFPEVEAAWVALIGVGFSINFSFFVSRRQAKIEILKLRSELEQIYAEDILKKRLEIYPGLYSVLAGVVRSIEFTEFSRSDLLSLQTQMEDWVENNGLLLSGNAGLAFHLFRLKLRKLLNIDSKKFEGQAKTIPFLREVRDGIHELELALKDDLGIYTVEFSEKAKKFKSYQEVEDFLNAE
jgi:hypothetical protein